MPSLCVTTLLPCRGPLPMQSQSVWLRDFEYRAREALEWLEITFLWQPRFSFTPASLLRHSPKSFPLLKAGKHCRVSAVTSKYLSGKTPGVGLVGACLVPGSRNHPCRQVMGAQIQKTLRRSPWGFLAVLGWGKWL